MSDQDNSFLTLENNESVNARSQQYGGGEKTRNNQYAKKTEPVQSNKIAISYDNGQADERFRVERKGSRPAAGYESTTSS